jgi:hypothetical protein
MAFTERRYGIKGTSRRHLGNVDVAFRERWDGIQGTLVWHSGNVGMAFRKRWDGIHGTLGWQSGNVDMGFIIMRSSALYPLVLLNCNSGNIDTTFREC